MYFLGGKWKESRNRREEAKQTPRSYLKFIPGHTPFLVGGRLGQDCPHRGWRNKRMSKETWHPPTWLPSKKDQEGEEVGMSVGTFGKKQITS